jgi:hypothetical protein
VKSCVTSILIAVIALSGEAPDFRGEADVIAGPTVKTVPTGPTHDQRDVYDTLVYTPTDGDWNAQFTMRPGDALLMVYLMPADGYITGVNVPVYEWGTGDQELTVSLHRLAYPNGADGTPYDPGVVDQAGWLGGYDLVDSTGAVFLTGAEYTPGGTPSVCPGESDVVADQARDPLLVEEPGEGPLTVPPQGLLWPDTTAAAVLTTSTHPDIVSGGGDNWISTADFGTQPDFLQGDWIGILVQFTGAGGGTREWTGFLYEEGDGVVEPWAFLKFYSDTCGGTHGATSGNPGWHIRHWIIDLELAVVFTGDRGPHIRLCDPGYLPVGSDTLCALITDDNPSGGPAGVEAAFFHYREIDAADPYQTLPLTLVSGDSLNGRWETALPYFPPWTLISWYLSAVDIYGNETHTVARTYLYIGPPGTHLILLYFNTEQVTFPYPLPTLDPCLYVDCNFYLGFDVWYASYGPLTEQLVAPYEAIIELAVQGEPLSIDDEVIAEWWSDGMRKYIVAGDEWLGVRYGWDVSGLEIPSQDVAREIFGITHYYSDINYGNVSDSQFGISRLHPVADDPITGDLMTFLGDSLYLNYDPYFELGADNWIDGIEVEPQVEVCMTALAGVLDSAAAPDPDTTEYITGIRNIHSNGGISVYFAFDPLALNTAPTYYWVGNQELQGLNLIAKTLEWIYGGDAVGNAGNLPDRFILHPNYPNPFNPVTTIRYELPELTHVRLAIYDLLGREVAVLVDQDQEPGVKTVTWDASRVASGIYFYQLTTSNSQLTNNKSQLTRKLVVLK